MHKSQQLAEAVKSLYLDLKQAGYEVLLDDRKARPGIMFADMELIGIPHRIVMSDRGLEAGTVEYKARGEGESRHIELGKLNDELQKLLN
jgi:prolyl-tRNA synthetase